MKIVLQYRVRLGDIVRILPFAAHLAKQKHEVFIECLPKYASLFNLVDYVKWKDPAAPVKDEKGKPLFDAIYPLAIWPHHAHEYRTETPARKFLDYVSDLHGDDFKGAKREIVFDHLPPIEPILAKYGLPAGFSIACPVGCTEMMLGDRVCSVPIDFYIFENWLNNSVRPRGNVFYVTPPGFEPNRRYVCVKDLAELASLIHHAIDFASICSAPAAIATARFKGKPLRAAWHYISPAHPRERLQDDITAKEAVRWEVQLNAAVPAIVPQKS
jgi:hypothetical protein